MTREFNYQDFSNSKLFGRFNVNVGLIFRLLSLYISPRWIQGVLRYVLLYTADTVQLQCDVMDVVALTTALHNSGVSFCDSDSVFNSKCHHSVVKVRRLGYLRAIAAIYKIT